MANRVQYPTIEQVRELPALFSEAIPAQWEDQNGHINVTFYMDLYNRSGWPMFALLGIDEDYFTKKQMGIVDLENHIRYFRELHVGNNISVYCRFFAHDEKRFHGMMIAANDDTNEVAATVEFLTLSVDLTKRKSAPIPNNVVNNLTELVNVSSELNWQYPTILSLNSKK